jgi:cytidylate kinase
MRAPGTDVIMSESITPKGGVMPRSIEQIVNERVLLWKGEQRASSRPPPSQTHAVVQRPMITISRQYGSLGGEIGRRVAKKLDCAFFSQELVHHIASRAHVRAQTVQSLDEQPRGKLEVMVREILDGEAFGAHDYRLALEAVLRGIARREPAVVIGRGGHLVLERDLTLRVRTYADVRSRIDNVVAREGLTADQARAKIRRIDDERVAFYRQQFGVEVAEPRYFDLLINTTYLPVDVCADIVSEAFRSRFGGFHGGNDAEQR